MVQLLTNVVHRDSITKKSESKPKSNTDYLKLTIYLIFSEPQILGVL